MYFIWGILFLMGVFTLWSPGWLVKLSDPGKNVEAISIKDAGDNYLKSDKFPEAIQQYKRALKIVPDLKSAIANLAVAYQKTGDYKKAIIAYNHLVTMDPEYPGVIYFNLGDIYEKTGNVDKSLNNYLLAIEELAFPEKAYQKAGKIFMNRSNWEKAVNYFSNAIENRRDIINSYRGMLLTYQKSYDDTSSVYLHIEKELNTNSYKDNLSDYDEVIFNQQLGNDIDLSKTYNNMGFCLAHLKKYDEAKGYLEIALKINPGNKEARNNLTYVMGFLQ